MSVQFSPHIFAMQVHGGISKYFVELSQALNKLEYGCASIIAPIYKNSYLNDGDGVIGIKFPNIRYTTDIILSAALMVGEAVNRVVPPDIVHETYYQTKWGRGRKARVTTVHDMIPELLGRPYGFDGELSRIKKLSVERSDHIICVSESTRNDLCALWDVDTSKVSVTYLATNHVEAPVEQPKKFDDLSGRQFILYVGLRSGYKNFDSLLNAFACSGLVGNGFDLVCFGGGSFTKNELNRQRAAGIPDGRVHCVSGDDLALAWAYSHAAVFVYPSLYEGFGLPLLEAMSHGCPTVCSNVSSMPEVVGKAAILFDPATPDDLVEKLTSLACSTDEMARLKYEGIIRASGFSWRTCAERTRDAYNSLL